jgi:phosphatidylinositol 4-kinase
LYTVTYSDQIVQFVLFAISSAGSISFSSYILQAATLDAQTGSWLNRGIAIAAITGMPGHSPLALPLPHAQLFLTSSVVCLIHAFAPRWGIWLSNGLGAFKLILLSLLVCTGFAALAGRMAEPSPGNFSSFHGPGGANTNDGYAVAASGYALALLQVLYSYSGWENANYVGGPRPARPRLRDD